MLKALTETESYINGPYSDLAKLAKERAPDYQTAGPFPHISFKNFFNPEVVDQVLEEFPDLMLGSYPKLDQQGYHTLLTLESRDQAYVNRAVDSLLARIPKSQLLRVE